MTPQLGHDRLIVLGTGTDEVLNRLAFAVSQVGDRFGGFAFEFAEFALEDDLTANALQDVYNPGVRNMD